jgi:polyferredoxin
MLLYFIQKFTPRTAGLLKTHSKICEMFLRLLGASKPLFHGQMTPQEAALNQVKTIAQASTSFVELLFGKLYCGVVWPIFLYWRYFGANSSHVSFKTL